MARLSSIPEAALSATSLALLEPTRIGGNIADVYLQFANSEAALAGYFAMEQSLRSGSLQEREIETVKLLVSQITRCDYCLSMHTMKARKAGLDASTQLAIREGRSTNDPRIDSITRIVRSFFEKPGVLDDSVLQQARSNGLTDANLVDITMAVSTIFFTNITNHINDTKPTMPPAPEIKSNG